MLLCSCDMIFAKAWQVESFFKLFVLFLYNQINKLVVPTGIDRYELPQGILKEGYLGEVFICISVTHSSCQCTALD